MLDDRIRMLDDARAVALLTAMADERLGAGLTAETAWAPEVEQALHEAVPGNVGAGGVSSGDLAREALNLLADDPECRETLDVLLAQPAAAAFEVVSISTIAVLTAALVVLQTHVAFVRDKEGKVSVKIEKLPTKDSLLTPLIRKILGFGARA